MALKLSQEEFISRCEEVHNFKYDYFITLYINARSKIEIICSSHGIFVQKALGHLQGHGCRKCFFDSDKLSFEEFLVRAKIVHGNTYIYQNYTVKFVTVICSKHGPFEQNKFNHLNGMGCRLCAVEQDKLTLDQFIKISNAAHNNKYDYSLSEYANNGTKIKIMCPDHGLFLQRPSHHMKGHGCPSCAHSISKMENQWLDDLNISKEFRQIPIKIDNRLFKVDGFDPATNTVYEFYGDFWHGNPKLYSSDQINRANGISFGGLYSKTMEKEQILFKNGYTIISKWESDFENENIK